MIGQLRNNLIRKLERIIGLPERARVPRLRRLMGLGAERCDMMLFRCLGFEHLERRTMLSANLGFAIGSGSTLDDAAYDVTTDINGNVYVTGEFHGTVDFDPTAGVRSLTSSGGSDAFVAKYTSNGSLLWVRGVGNTANNGGRGIAVDNAGNTYITGWFEGVVDFDVGGSFVSLFGSGAIDSFVLKLDANANYVWASALAGTSETWTSDIAVDNVGNVYTAGTFSGTTDFKPGVGTSFATAVGSYDAFISKIDANGDFVWAETFGGTGADEINGLALDSVGNVLVTGQFEGTADFDPLGGVTNLTSLGREDIFVSKLDGNGNLTWATSMGGTGSDFSNDIAIDSNDKVILAGSFQGMVDFDPGIGSTLLLSAGANDVFVAKLTGAGDLMWAQGMGGINDDAAFAVAIGNGDGIFLAGEFNSQGIFDFNGDMVTDLNVSGVSSGFVAKYDASGGFTWSGAMGGSGSVSATGIAVDLSGVYVTGSLVGTADFDPSAGTSVLTSAGATDMFLMQLVGNSPPTTSGIADVTVNEDAPNTFIDLSTAFYDAEDGYALTFSIRGNTNPALFAGISIAADGMLTLDYAANKFGTADITITATDSNGASVDTTFRVKVNSVNDAPITVDDQSSIQQDQTLYSSDGVLANDLDIEGDQLSATLVTGTSHGDLQFASDGSLNYTPNPGFTGIDTFAYVASDGVNISGVAIVTIYVVPATFWVDDGSLNSQDNLFDDQVQLTDNPTAPFVYYTKLTETASTYDFDDSQQTNDEASQESQLVFSGASSTDEGDEAGGEQTTRTTDSGGEGFLNEGEATLFHLHALAAPVDDDLLLNSAHLEGDESVFVFERITEKGETTENPPPHESEEAEIHSAYTTDGDLQTVSRETAPPLSEDIDELFAGFADFLTEGEDELVAVEAGYSLAGMELDPTVLAAIATTIVGGKFVQKRKEDRRRSVQDQTFPPPLNGKSTR